MRRSSSAAKQFRGAEIGFARKKSPAESDLGGAECQTKEKPYEFAGSSFPRWELLGVVPSGTNGASKGSRLKLTVVRKIRAGQLPRFGRAFLSGTNRRAPN
jgi:hypothetical protein